MDLFDYLMSQKPIDTSSKEDNKQYHFTLRNTPQLLRISKTFRNSCSCISVVIIHNAFEGKCIQEALQNQI